MTIFTYAEELKFMYKNYVQIDLFIIFILRFKNYIY